MNADLISWSFKVVCKLVLQWRDARWRCPNSSSARVIQGSFYLFMVDEFYTFKICCDCKACLERCMNKDRDKVSGFHEIHRVTYCRNCPMKITLSQSRDGNAARNILAKGQYILGYDENDPKCAKKHGRMSDKMLKFYATDPNRPNIQLKIQEGTCRGYPYWIRSKVFHKKILQTFYFATSFGETLHLCLINLCYIVAIMRRQKMWVYAVI